MAVLDGIEIERLILEQRATHKLTAGLRNKINAAKYPPRMMGLPAIPSFWHQLALFLDTDPHETKIILENTLAAPTDTIKDALKHIMLVGKITHGDHLSEHRRLTADYRRKFEVEQAKYDALMANMEDYKEQLAELDRQRNGMLTEVWQGIKDTVQQACEQHDSQVSEIQGDAAIILPILVNSSKHVNVVDGKYVIDWTEVNKFHYEHVNQILYRLAEKLKAIKAATESESEVSLNVAAG